MLTIAAQSPMMRYHTSRGAASAHQLCRPALPLPSAPSQPCPSFPSPRHSTVRLQAPEANAVHGGEAAASDLGADLTSGRRSTGSSSECSSIAWCRAHRRAALAAGLLAVVQAAALGPESAQGWARAEMLASDLAAEEAEVTHQVGGSEERGESRESESESEELTHYQPLVPTGLSVCSFTRPVLPEAHLFMLHCLHCLSRMVGPSDHLTI